MALRNHAACVGSYCDAILSGEIIAGRYVELAVRRYLDDIEHAHERGLYFDAEIAEKSLQFVETVCTQRGLFRRQVSIFAVTGSGTLPP